MPSTQGSLFFSPYFQFVDATGIPYAGGTVAFYQSGTNTPLATYSDQALTIANPNPVPLNTGGFTSTQVWLQNLEYRVVLFNSSGVQIWTADPVAAGGNFTETVQVVGSGEIGFRATNTSANGNDWGWYSQATGAFEAIDSTTGITVLSLSGSGTMTMVSSPTVISSGSIGINLTCTAVSGQDWQLFSHTDGTAGFYNASTAETPFYIEADGTAVFAYGTTFVGAVAFSSAVAFSQPVVINTTFTANSTSDFVGAVTFAADALFSSTVEINGIVTVTAPTALTAINSISPGLEMTNTSSSGRSWLTYSNTAGAYVIADQTAAVTRITIDLNGTVTVLGAGAGIGTGTYGYLANTGAGTLTGTYNYALSVPNGITSAVYSATSDRRLKTDIEEISEVDAWEYVMAARPVTFVMKGSPMAGFIAQEEAKGPRQASISLVENGDLAQTVDEDGFVSPAGFQLTKNYDHDIAYLTRALQMVMRLVEAQGAELSAMKKGNV